MVVILPSPNALTEIQKAGEIGVQLYFDETSYKTMFNALSTVIQAKGNRLAYLRDVLLGKTPAGRRILFPMRFPWLNLSQEEAVNHVLRQRMCQSCTVLPELAKRPLWLKRSMRLCTGKIR